ncbi:hypothetical protein [Paenibacillus lentus]|uniref:RiboL-PSP-HEPN domain-containing protein n=1 Tax=Paenibacillus lentus TaxID=1338368 RepID=A0A3S8RQE0_9BACL|nr:hypothetical protein [Paenibacillus lentus]AZK45194.1 hypothetical protein EIM92_02425 [Paenibacillus lentus]
MSNYKGKFFKGRDFYEWGIDHEVIKLKDKFLTDINLLKFYRSNFSQDTKVGTINLKDLTPIQNEIIEIYLSNASLDDLDNILHSHKEDLINKYPWITKIVELEKRLEERDSFIETLIADQFMKQLHIHNKMCLINTYTLLDEYLTELIKALGMYLSEFLSKVNIKVNYKQLLEFENDTDLKEFFIDSAMLSDKNLSGAVNKVNYLLKHLNAKDEFKWLKDIILLNEERNCIIHNKGYFNKKAIKNIGEEIVHQLKLSENMKVQLDNKKVDSYIDITDEIIDFFSAKIMKNYYAI